MFLIDAHAPTDTRRRCGLRCLAAVVAVAWLAAPTTARAQVDYVLSGVTANFNGTPETISGSFIVGGGEWRAYLQVTGPMPFAGSYSCGNCLGGNILHLQDPGPGVVGTSAFGTLQIGFTAVGGAVGDQTPITSIMIGGVTGTDLTGAAVKVGQAVEYSFLNASTILNGTPETITGNFIFDSLTDIEYFANIRLTGSSPYAGESEYDAEQGGAGNLMNTDALQIVFANDLPSSGVDPLLSVQFINGVVDNAPTGFACANACVVAAPEPTSLTILSAALGMFLLGRWAVQRASQVHPN